MDTSHTRVEDTSARPAPPSSLLLFVRMWAMAHIIHLVVANGSRLDTPWNVGTVAAAVALLIRPTSGRLLAAMMILQLCDFVAELPWSPDHWALLSLINLALLATMLARRSFAIETIAVGFPAARAIVLVAYSAAALSKYNTSFLDPVTSCANALAGAASFGLTDRLGQTPLLAIGSIAMETSIPLLLAWPRTRRHGVRVAMAFHFILSASPGFAVVDFTAALFALFVLFLSDDDTERLLDRIRGIARRSAIARDARRRPWVTAFIAFVMTGFAGYFVPPLVQATVFVLTELYLFGLLIAAWSTWRATASIRQFGRSPLVTLPVLVLTVLWASSPYLGFRTAGVFTMFSGIRTEGSVANHLFMPHGAVTPWPGQLVTLRSSSDPVLTNAAEHDLAIPLMSLRRMATDDPTLTVEGILDGRLVTWGPAPDQTVLAPLADWQYRLLLFRPVSVEDQPFCSIS